MSVKMENGEIRRRGIGALKKPPQERIFENLDRIESVVQRVTSLIDDTFEGRARDSLGATEMHDPDSGITYVVRPSDSCSLPRKQSPDSTLELLREGDAIQLFMDPDEDYVTLPQWVPAIFHEHVPGHACVVWNKQDREFVHGVALRKVRFADVLAEEVAIATREDGDSNAKRRKTHKK